MNARNQDSQKKTKKAATADVNASNAPDRPKVQQHRTDEKRNTLTEADETAQTTRKASADRTGGQNQAIDQKRNDEQQYHAGGAAHDPHNQTQERVDRGDPDAGDIDEVSRAESAPYNKTYGHHQ